MRDSIEISSTSNTFEENKNKLLGEIHDQFNQWIKNNPVGLDGTDPSCKTLDLKNTKIRDFFIEHINQDNNLKKGLGQVYKKSNNWKEGDGYSGFWTQFNDIKKHVYNWIVVLKNKSDQSTSLESLLCEEILKNSEKEINNILNGKKSTEGQIKEIKQLIKDLLAQKHREDLEEALLPGELVD